MSLICVSGATSRAGKTALLASVVRQLLPRGATAVKFTTTDDVFERCPRGTPCVVCDIDVPYRIVSESEVLRQPGTDTDRMAQAGARRVLWAIAKQSAVEHAWARVSSLLEPGLQVTISIGLDGDTSRASVGDMLSAADERLYEAKHSGRNRVVAAQVPG